MSLIQDNYLAILEHPNTGIDERLKQLQKRMHKRTFVSNKTGSPSGSGATVFHLQQPSLPGSAGRAHSSIAHEAGRSVSVHTSAAAPYNSCGTSRDGGSYPVTLGPHLQTLASTLAVYPRAASAPVLDHLGGLSGMTSYKAAAASVLQAAPRFPSQGSSKLRTLSSCPVLRWHANAERMDSLTKFLIGVDLGENNPAAHALPRGPERLLPPPEVMDCTDGGSNDESLLDWIPTHIFNMCGRTTDCNVHRE
jgi:hypothetical protein